MGRYLKGNKKAVYRYRNQKMPDRIVVWSDSDFAGCKRTRKSTSGGVVMFGGHCLKTYASTQPLIALSVGEAEFSVQGSGSGSESADQHGLVNGEEHSEQKRSG